MNRCSSPVFKLKYASNKPLSRKIPPFLYECKKCSREGKFFFIHSNNFLEKSLSFFLQNIVLINFKKCILIAFFIDGNKRCILRFFKIGINKFRTVFLFTFLNKHIFLLKCFLKLIILKEIVLMEE